MLLSTVSVENITMRRANMLHSTESVCFTWPVSTWTTSHQTSARSEHTILPLQLWSRTQSITSASFSSTLSSNLWRPAKNGCTSCFSHSTRETWLHGIAWPTTSPPTRSLDNIKMDWDRRSTWLLWPRLFSEDHHTTVLCRSAPSPKRRRFDQMRLSTWSWRLWAWDYWEEVLIRSTKLQESTGYSQRFWTFHKSPICVRDYKNGTQMLINWAIGSRKRVRMFGLRDLAWHGVWASDDKWNECTIDL